MKVLLFITLLTLLALANSTNAQTVSGFIRDISSSPISNAVVEAWDWDNDILVSETNTDGSGAYTLIGLTNGIQYTIRAFKLENMSTITNPSQCWAVEHQGFIPDRQLATAPVSGINFNLDSIPVENVDYFTSSGLWTQFYGLTSVYEDQLLRKGDVITSYDPDGVLNGVGYQCWDSSRGWYVIDTWGDDSDTGGQDEGALDGDILDFYINGIASTNTSGNRVWDRTTHNTELSTTGGTVNCEITNAFWNQSTAIVDDLVEVWINTTACAGEEISFTITEGGTVSRGPASIQPVNVYVDFTESAHSNWTAEWVDDSAGGDSNPPEYYFTSEVVGTPSTNIDSRTFGEYLDVYPDTMPPLVINDTRDYFGENIIITWKTDEPATTQVDYGKTLSYGNIVSDATLVTDHMIIINGIDLDDLYYYRITSRDSAFNSNSSVTGTFTVISPVVIELQHGAHGYYFGVNDTYLYSLGDYNLGGMPDIRLGEAIDNERFSYPLLKFNTTIIPTGATVLSAHLDLYYYDVLNNASAPKEMTGSLYRVLRYWGWVGNGTSTSNPIYPGMVTWNYTEYSTNSWGISGVDQIGIDRESSPQDNVFFDINTPFGWQTWNIQPSLAQAWIDTPSSNNGVVLKTPPQNNATRYRFRSSDTGLTSERPKLVITYTKGAPPVCPDPNEDLVVNIIDLAMTTFWQGKSNTNEPVFWESAYDHMDHDQNGQINFADVLYVTNRFGNSC